MSFNRGEGLISKRNLLIITVILIGAISYGFYYFNVVKVPQIPFFSEENIYQLDIEKDWQAFKKELEITSEDIRIQDFSVDLTNAGNIETVRFDLAIQHKNKFTIYHYNGCQFCPEETDNQIRISKSTVDEWLQYPRMVNADEFFNKLQIINQQKIFNRDKELDVFLVSSGWNEGIALPGEYYLLEENKLRKLIPASDNLYYHGFNLQLVEDNNQATTDENTRTIFIGQFVEKKNE